MKATLAEKLAEGRFVVTVEVDPPLSADAGDLLAKLADLPPLDAVNLADSPMARVRMSAVALGHLVLEKLHLEPLLHYTCRDRNVLAIQSELLGAAALGIRNVLALTGDPPAVGDYPWATSVFEVTSTGLIQLIQGLNSGHCLAGKGLKAPTQFLVGAAVNLTPENFERERQKVKEKVAAGAEFFISQPIFDPVTPEAMVEVVQATGVPLIAGLMPLTSSRRAEYFHHEVPGVDVPEELRRRLAEAKDAESARRVGLEAAREILAWCQANLAGVCIMPLGDLELAGKLLEGRTNGS